MRARNVMAEAGLAVSIGGLAGYALGILLAFGRIRAASWIIGLAMLAGIVGTVFGSIGLARAGRLGAGKGAAIAGLTCGVIGGVLVPLFGIVMSLLVWSRSAPVEATAVAAAPPAQAPLAPRSEQRVPPPAPVLAPEPESVEPVRVPRPAQLGSLDLTVEPITAQAAVDGRPIDLDRGHGRVPLTAGAHQLRVSRTGYVAISRTISISDSSIHVDVRLERVVAAKPAKQDDADDPFRKW